ncbi:MAG: toll/interleukin-1 receptor domain-containing protein [Bosea sp.]|uniref:toll/interleukin-1 receptor domain-containing protein n=1 Tax=Bosea sp. (in: a-proteobacteria) TaxID=1871050 RepID=UPI00239BAC0F|nr:toll/interleukin-1 receptor domain-containing protein [Bosea sp. (in: a-proteobacteria)]MCP4733806.1 toll/interleukin-1 receptor domain-containing protein [Bosea sp. (in: a-proteobacteria)]
MRIFLSHNSADKVLVRTLAMLLAGEGLNLFFDEWDIRLGDPLIGSIERGLQEADVFIIVWSEAARRSNWVDVELQTFMRRRIDNQALRIVPLMLDATPLPALLSNFAGMNLAPDNPTGNTVETVVRALVGDRRDIALAQQLQARINQLAREHLGDADPFGWLVCPACASDRIKRSTTTDYDRDEVYYLISCEACGNGDWTQ